LRAKIFHSTLKNALAYYVVAVNLKVVGLAQGPNPTTSIFYASVVKKITTQQTARRVFKVKIIFR
jgi:hypothetical protein